MLVVRRVRGFLSLILIYSSEICFPAFQATSTIVERFELETTHQIVWRALHKHPWSWHATWLAMQNLLRHVITTMFRLLFTSWPMKTHFGYLTSLVYSPATLKEVDWISICLHQMAGRNKHNSRPHNHDSLTVEHAPHWERLQGLPFFAFWYCQKNMSKYSIPAQSFWMSQGWQLHILS